MHILENKSIAIWASAFNKAWYYGTASNAYAQQRAAQSQMMGNIFGGGLGALGTMGAGFLMSSQRYKDNIVAWE